SRPHRTAFTLFVIHHPSSLIFHSSSIIYHPSSVIRHPSSVIHHPSSVIRHPSSVIYSIFIFLRALSRNPTSISDIFLPRHGQSERNRSQARFSGTRLMFTLMC